MKLFCRILILFFVPLLFKICLPAGAGFLPGRCLAQVFLLEGQASVAQGVISRKAEISEPFSGSYVKEHLKVTGRAEIKDSFALYVWPPARDASDNLVFRDPYLWPGKTKSAALDEASGRHFINSSYHWWDLF